MHAPALPKSQGTVTPRREMLCVWGWAMWAPGRARVGRGGCLRASHPQEGVVTCSQLCSTSHTGCLVTLHSYIPGVQHRTGVPPGFQWLRIFPSCQSFFLSVKNAMKLLALSIRLVSLPRHDYGTCISNLRKYTKILWNYFKYLMLDLAVLIWGPAYNQISLLCLLPIPWPEAAHLKLRSLQQESCFETSTAIESDKIDWRNKGAQEKNTPA